MDRLIKFSGVILWSSVFITMAFSYTGVNYSDNKNLKVLCDNYSPQNISDTKLGSLLSGLNKLRLELSSNDLDNAIKSDSSNWIDTCAGQVMMEVKSRKFEKKLQKQSGVDSR